eukprot:jgi/Ulvmu1/1830/UM119_0049.1
MHILCHNPYEMRGISPAIVHEQNTTHLQAFQSLCQQSPLPLRVLLFNPSATLHLAVIHPLTFQAAVACCGKIRWTATSHTDNSSSHCSNDWLGLTCIIL